jgi:O-antigen/teichoic acid export membrane protein
VSAAPAPTAVLRRVLANTGVLIGGRTANAIISLAYLALAARTLGVGDVGVLFLINAFAQLVGDVVKFNAWQTVLHYGASALAGDDADGVHRVVRFTLFLDITSGLAGVAAAVGIALLAGGALGWTPAQSPAAALYCLSIALMTPSTPIGLLRLFDRFDLIAIQAPVGSLVRLAGCGLAFALDASMEAFLAIWALGTIASFLFLAGAAWREMHRRGLSTGFKWRGPLTQQMPGAWRFAWATNLSTTLETAFTHAITLVVGAVAGPAPAALWRIGRQVADAVAKPARLLIPALYPELARLNATEGERAMGKLASQVGLVGAGLGGALILAALFGRPLLTLVLGPDFAPAGDIMVWQMAAAAVGIWSLPLEPMLVSLGRPGDVVKVRIVVSVVMLASLPAAIQAFGLTGAGASLLAAMAAMAAGMYLLLKLGGRKAACTKRPVQ